MVQQKKSDKEDAVKQRTLLAALALAVVFLGTPLAAHHGWAAFEGGKTITLKGVVTDFHFVNPHSVVEFQVKDAKGALQAWEGELTSPNHLASRGWTASSLDEGDGVTITGYPAKNGTHALRITKIMLANGKTLKVGGIK
jgi:Family of unknown function (DUF6152)